MKAIGYKKVGPIDAEESFVAFEADKPTVGPRDLLVQVKGISLNPVDVKVRSAEAFAPKPGETKIIGYDAAGVVVEVGSEVTGKFKVGDEVFYAGDIFRPGSNAEFQAVDERIVGRKPKSVDFAEAAAYPLTTITAWEMLFDCFGLPTFPQDKKKKESILILGAAGGVGSILVQLAKKVAGLTVIATASRPETVEWVKKMGADHVVDHHGDLKEQVDKLCIGAPPGYVCICNGIDKGFPVVVDLIKPRGRIANIDDPKNKLDMDLVKFKSLTYSHEFMFCRPHFETDDMDEQGKLLDTVSGLVDAGEIVSTCTNNLGTLSAETLKKAHKEQESGRVIGKNVLSVAF